MLNRMETTWEKVFSTEDVHLDVLQKATEGVIIRRNSFDNQVVQCAMHSPQNVIQKITQLRIMLKGNCRAVKFFFDDVKHNISNILEELGFQKTEDRSWVLDTQTFLVKSTFKPAYTDSSLVMEVQSKKGNNIPSTASHIAMLFDSMLRERNELIAS